MVNHPNRSKSKKVSERDEAIAKMREWLKPGDTVYTILEHVSSSGMTRDIRVLVPVLPDEAKGAYAADRPEISFLHPNYSVALAIGERLTPVRGRDGIRVGGCGMDMGFHIVYNLSRVMFPDGFTCCGKGCPSNDHSNGDRIYTPHNHSDGGYALKHRWM